jgi:CheY-like chemotaxis protein
VTTELGAFDLVYVGQGGLLDDAEPSTRPSCRRRVVVADDSSVMRKTIARTLGDSGYEVVGQASNGQEAIEEFRRKRPDLLVLDICMPVMGGLDALRVIHSEDPSARVLMSSAIAEVCTIGKSLREGAVGYVTKPFKQHQLLDAVYALFHDGDLGTGTLQEDDSSPLDVSNLGGYRVGKLLGEGGMAVVCEGIDCNLDRKIALKVIRDALAGNVDFVVQFLEEARAVARVNHPNVVSVYSAGSDRGKHFFAMELLPGPDLQALVTRDGPMAPPRALQCLHQGARGLSAAHRQGLIHCDVKPSNLVFGSDGQVVVTDFGIARRIAGDDGPATSVIVGTPSFMAPEQVLGTPVDHRTDIYCLGATLYFLLTGEPPYSGQRKEAVALCHLHNPVPELTGELAPLNPLLTRLMAKIPDERPADYDAVLAALDDAKRGVRAG